MKIQRKSRWSAGIDAGVQARADRWIGHGSRAPGSRGLGRGSDEPGHPDPAHDGDRDPLSGGAGRAPERQRGPYTALATVASTPAEQLGRGHIFHAPRQPRIEPDGLGHHQHFPARLFGRRRPANRSRGPAPPAPDPGRRQHADSSLGAGNAGPDGVSPPVGSDAGVTGRACLTHRGQRRHGVLKSFVTVGLDFERSLLPLAALVGRRE